ncbi:MAG: CBS domain-containing protein [Desulfatibacillum sp.]|nr:CBS domain-containing protein [Desulfatibacillum sp.]
MVPLDQYATVHEDANLYEAVIALEECQARQDNPDPRAILVVDKKNHVVGKMSFLDVIKALEPSYETILESRPGSARLGFSRRFLKLLADDYKLWSNPLDEICKKAADIKVKDVMYSPSSEGEFVSEDATLPEAMHQIIMGHHQSLLVMKNKRITGILRVKEVFAQVVESMKACGI